MFLQSLSPLFLSTYVVKCRRTFLKLNSKRPYPNSEREIKFRRCLSTFSTEHEIRHFHVIVVQKRQRNVPKNVMHLRSCCCASRCGRNVESLRLGWHGWHKLSKLTNHRMYQELVYRNDVLKTILTGSNYPSLQSHPPPPHPAVFVQLLSMRSLPTILEPGTGYVDSRFPVLHFGSLVSRNWTADSNRWRDSL